MRATQFVRRGLVAFAAVATLTLGLSGVANAQAPGAFPGNSPGAVVDGDDAIVWVPVPGYVYDIVHTDGERTAVLGCGIGEALQDGMGRGMYERSRIPCVLRSSFAAV